MDVPNGPHVLPAVWGPLGYAHTLFFIAYAGWASSSHLHETPSIHSSYYC
jgi:hypothetical protein